MDPEDRTPSFRVNLCRKYTHQSPPKGVFGDHTRIGPILHVLITTQSSRNVFTTAQSQIQPSRRTLRSDTTLGSDRSPWRSYRLLDHSIYLQRSCVVSGRKNVNRIHDREKCGSRGKLHTSSLPKSIVNSVTLSGGQSCSSGGFTQDTQKLSFLSPEDDERRQSAPAQFQGSDHLYVDVQRHGLDPKPYRKLHADKIQRTNLLIPELFPAGR